jgi:hypothetical protein
MHVTNTQKRVREGKSPANEMGPAEKPCEKQELTNCHYFVLHYRAAVEIVMLW